MPIAEAFEVLDQLEESGYFVSLHRISGGYRADLRKPANVTVIQAFAWHDDGATAAAMAINNVAQQVADLRT